MSFNQLFNDTLIQLYNSKQDLYDNGIISDWEYSFLVNMSEKPKDFVSLSPRQLETIKHIVARADAGKKMYRRFSTKVDELQEKT